MTIEELDPKYHRLKYDIRDKQAKDDMTKMAHHEIVDHIYSEYRLGVDREIHKVDNLFLTEISKTRVADEIELSNLLFEKEAVQKQIKKKEEVKQFLDQTKNDFYASVTQNEKEKVGKA